VLRNVGGVPGSANPLYFLHVPKTAGSSLTRLLEDAFPAGARLPVTFVDELARLPADAVDASALLCGHLGRLPLELATGPLTVVTVLREPAARAWSHFTSLPARWASFGALLDDPVYGTIAADFQARWLGVTPTRDLGAPATPGLGLADPFGPDARLEPAALERSASATLDACSLVGTVERIGDVREALGRLLGRWLPPLPKLNLGDAHSAMSAEDAARVRARSALDERLVERAGMDLERALSSLPPLPAEPLAVGPFTLTMADPFAGTGWHARVRTAPVGWHRWTGPGRVASVRLPVRVAGPARVEIDVVAACDDDALRGLRVRVQGRTVQVARVATGECARLAGAVVLQVDDPLEVEVEVPHTRPLVDGATGARSPDPAGLAVREIRVLPD
jgi:hypothetical protein